jgi:phosphatidylglycerol:prolipoprotein diacylglycerol transferase
VHPELFRFSEVGFPAYFVLLVSGFLFATAIGALWARRIGESADVVVDLGIAMLIAGVAGARILHVFVDGYFWDYVHLCTAPELVNWPLDRGECLSSAYDGVWDAAKGVCHPKAADCFAWAKFWSGGLTYYGGLAGASLAAWFLLRRDKFPFWKAADMAGFAIPLGLAFGRIGCLLAGCCFGATCDLPWAIAFPGRSPASDEQFRDHLIPSAKAWSLPVHPTQIYESAASLAIAAFCLLWLHPRKRYDGQVFAASMALYAAARFGIEFLRRDDRGGLFGLSTSQWIGIALLALAAAVHAARGMRGKSGGDAERGGAPVVGSRP